MGEDEGGAGDAADFAGAYGDVLESPPAALEQGEPPFAEARGEAIRIDGDTNLIRSGALVAARCLGLFGLVEEGPDVVVATVGGQLFGEAG